MISTPVCLKCLNGGSDCVLDIRELKDRCLIRFHSCILLEDCGVFFDCFYFFDQCAQVVIGHYYVIVIASWNMYIRYNISIESIYQYKQLI